jgi:acylphosphatase
MTAGNSSIIHKNIRVTGRVQGVGFRYSARQVAGDLGIKGFVRNLPDGDVYIEAEGTQTRIDDFIAWCSEGPSRALIRFVDVTDAAVVNFKEFNIR